MITPPNRSLSRSLRDRLGPGTVLELTLSLSLDLMEDAGGLGGGIKPGACGNPSSR